MAENLTIARPYAQAVFEIAKDDRSFDSWSNALQALACAASDEQFLAFLEAQNTPELAADKLIELIGDDLLGKKAKNFVGVVCENKRLAVLPEIYQDFIKLRDDFLHVKSVEIISARPLSSADEKAIITKLSKKYDADIELTRTIDPSIMGGVIIKIGDEVIDGSVQSNLSRLSSTLK